MAKRRNRIFPRFALMVALGTILGIVLWRYDKFSHARMLREMRTMRDFLLQYQPVKVVTND